MADVMKETRNAGGGAGGGEMQRRRTANSTGGGGNSSGSARNGGHQQQQKQQQRQQFHSSAPRPIAVTAPLVQQRASGGGTGPQQQQRGSRGRHARDGGGHRGRAAGGASVGGASRKASAREDAATTPLFVEDSPSSSYDEGNGFSSEAYNYYGSSPSASSSGGSSPLSSSPAATGAPRFNVYAPSFRPSPSGSAPVAISLSASSPGVPATSFPQPHEVPAEERRRDRKDKRRISKSDNFRVPANYLLNFSYERPQQQDWSTPARRRGPVVEYKKERFLQANYRFVVNAQGNYMQHLYETDQLVEWDDIEQIVLQTSVPYNCPICLDAPMAPKMTKCGHIYCWSCISRYLGMAQKGWRKCPICFDSVSTKHLKSAAIEIVPEYHEDENIVFTLMRRHKDSTVALPSVRWRPMERLLRHDDPDSIFSRIVLVDDITPILDKEQEELAEALALARASQDYEPIPYLDDAMKSLQERREQFAAKQAASRPPTKPVSEALKGTSQEHTNSAVWSGSEGDEEKDSAGPSSALIKAEHNKQKLGSDESKDKNKQEEEEQEDDQHRDHQSGTTITTSPDIFYFYQASDGQNIFMHPLSFRCLHKEVVSFDKLPPTVEGKIVQLEEVTQSDKMRKRRKMIIGHLPLSTQFQFCEIDVRHLVSEKTLASFADEFKFREAKRNQLKQERAPAPSPSPAPTPVTQTQSDGADDDPELAAALAESRRMTAEAAPAAANTLSAPPPAVSIPTTPSSELAASMPPASGGGLQGVWAQKQSAAPAVAKKQAPAPSSKPASQQGPTFSQVARNQVWSGWKDDAFPSFDAAQQTNKRNQHGAANGSSSSGGGGKGKKKQVLLVSNTGGRRY